MQGFIKGILVLIFFAGCGERPPRDVIPEKKMVAVLMDVHLADAYSSSVPMDSMRALQNSLYEGIYQKYGTDSTGLRASLEYYASRPQIMDALYSKVNDGLQKLVDREQDIENEKMRQTQIQDSIRLAAEQDSLRKVARDSADFKEKRYLLHWLHGDSVKLKPGEWTKERYREDFLNRFGYPVGHEWPAEETVVPADSAATPIPAPVPGRPASGTVPDTLPKTGHLPILKKQLTPATH